jgi:hypothetical protein
MKPIQILAVIVFAAVFFTAFTPNARAGLPNRKTIVTFSQPVEIPGLVLPAGTYVFERADSSQHVVRIFNADETHIFATLLTVPEYLLGPVDKTVITFEERLPGGPEALQAWFYPGDTVGEEFLYLKSVPYKRRGGVE